ncbi:MAG TPA: hypothetical protein VMB34_19740 [Acetobacteraceae bacterium]|nr:hypothetical protein [Acetobacteraceae bacterium]
MTDVTAELRDLRFQIECLAQGLQVQDSTLRRMEEKIDEIIEFAIEGPEDEKEKNPLIETLRAILAALDKIADAQQVVLERLAV